MRIRRFDRFGDFSLFQFLAKQSKHARGLMLTLAVIGVLTFAVAGWRLVSVQEMAAMNARTTQLRATLDIARRDQDSPPAQGSFVQELAQHIDVAPIVQQIQQASEKESVSLTSIVVNSRGPTPDTLGRLSLAVSLRGSYPKIKTVISAVFSRHPGVMLENLSIRRAGNTTELDVRIDFLLLSRPAARHASGR